MYTYIFTYTHIIFDPYQTSGVMAARVYIYIWGYTMYIHRSYLRPEVGLIMGSIAIAGGIGYITIICNSMITGSSVITF